MYNCNSNALLAEWYRQLNISHFLSILKLWRLVYLCFYKNRWKINLRVVTSTALGWKLTFHWPEFPVNINCGVVLPWLPLGLTRLTDLHVFPERARMRVGFATADYFTVVRFIASMNMRVLLTIRRIGEPTLTSSVLTLKRLLTC